MRRTFLPLDPKTPESRNHTLKGIFILYFNHYSQILSPNIMVVTAPT